MAQAANPTLVVGWDFSDTAPQVLTWAADYAKLAGGWIVMVHVLEMAPSDIPLPAPSPEEFDRMKASMREAASRLGVEVLTEVLMAHSVSQALMEAARRHGASLLCVGRNRTGLARLLLGSVAAQVARNSAIPVLVVPPAS